MRNTYFDGWRFEKILKKIDSNPHQAKILFEDYFTDYPNDYSAYSYYASLLITLGLFDEARETLNQLKENYIHDNNYFAHNSDKKINILRKNIIYAEIKLLCRQEKYQEAIDFYYQNYSYTKDMDIEKIILYCKVKLNIVKNTDRNKYFYMIRQSIEYQYSDFQYHLKGHLDDVVFDDEERYSIFNNNFPIDSVITEIDKYLMSDKRLLYGFIEDVYFFKYDECGLFNGKSSNFLKVVTFQNSKNIITIYPFVGCEELPYVDLNYMKAENKIKIKRPSQIDKFNKRFSIK